MHRVARRKGLSEMIGALFIIALLVVAFSFTLTMFTAFKGYQSSVNQRAQYTSDKPTEQHAKTSQLYVRQSNYTQSVPRLQ